MDTSKLTYSKEFLSATKTIKQTAIPALKTISSTSFSFDQATRSIVENSALSSNLLTKSPLMKSLEEQYRNIFRSIPSSVINFQEGLTLPSTNFTAQIASSIPKLDVSSITQSFKSTPIDLPNHDFRIGVLGQEITNDLSELFDDTFETVNKDEDDKRTDFDENLLKSSVYTKDKDQQTQDIAEIKELFWKIYEYQRDHANQSFKENVQKEEQSSNSKNPYQLKILAFINSVLLIFSIMTAPKEVYEFLVWIDEILSFLINK